MSPDQSGSPRTKHPFMGAGDQKVAPKIGETEILHAEGVDAVDAKDDPILFGS